ncbi:hypothetical protein GCM10020331_051220 [Ectobacillus funiculus]
MTVKKIATIDTEFHATGDGYAPEGKIIDKTGVEKSKDLDKLFGNWIIVQQYFITL